jgi:branched-chain amino acid transport system permease protein
LEYVFHIVVIASIYTVLAVSLDLVAGHTGMLSLAHAAFYGIGAYITALLAVTIGTPFYAGIPVGMAVAGTASILVSVPGARLRGDYFAIATLGFQVIVWSLFNNWVSVTRGPLGIPGIPQMRLFGWTFASPISFAVLTCVIAIVSYALVTRIVSSPFGRVLRAIREDEDFVLSLGRNPVYFKVVTFAFSAALAAAAGGLYAYYVTFIDPTSFTVMESILILSMVIIGGAGSRWGPLVGAVILVAFPEVLRFVGLPSSVAASLRQIFYGSMLIGMMMFRPNGLMGHYKFGR